MFQRCYKLYCYAIKTNTLLQIFGLMAFIEQKENNIITMTTYDNNDNHFPMEDSSESFEYTVMIEAVHISAEINDLTFI